MDITSYITVFSNIFINFSYLKSDFVGIIFDPGGFTYFVLNIFFVIILISVYYLIGRKIRLFFFESNNYKIFNNYINIALGYIIVNTGLAILGIFSLFYSPILWAYIGIILITAFYSCRKLKHLKNEITEFVIAIKIKIKNNKFVFLGVFLFVIIAFLRLIPPEIGEDAIGYHTGDPHSFLVNRTTLIQSKMPPYVMPAPHLGEMSYVLSEFIGLKDSARYIHFSFYLLVVLLLVQVSPYGALFFVTAPVVIQVSSKGNVDFQWILGWLLSIFIITLSKQRGIKDMILVGILFGGVLASKLWTIAFFPLFVLYLLIFYKKLPLVYRLGLIFVFSLSALLVDFIWLWRSFIISGNPLYPMLSTIPSLDGTGGALGFGNVIGFNKLMFHMRNVSVLSPLLYLGIIASVLHWRYALSVLRKFRLSSFFVLLATEYLFIQYHFGRYLLGLYSLGVLIISATIEDMITKYNLYRVIFIIGFSILFFYYFINTLLFLPYGFGWADNNKYLTRIIFRDNTNYYNFNHIFGKWISNKDKVATYGIYGFYYADFDYIDINYIFDKSNKSFNLLSQKNVTKLFIKGGDILWFCKTLNLYGCSTSKVKLLASYPEEIRKYNLYSIIDNR